MSISLLPSRAPADYIKIGSSDLIYLIQGMVAMGSSMKLASPDVAAWNIRWVAF
jgi:hypothetical protein